MSEDKKPLNLDELFGDARAVKVIHDKREYELVRVEALGPKQAVKLQKMQRQAQVLQSLGDEITEEQGNEIEALFGNIINLLCPEFPVDEVSFAKKVRIVTFYMEETEGKKAMETVLKNLTGQTSSRG